MAKGISTKGKEHSIARGLTFLLSVLYIAGTSHLEFIHSFVHPHDDAVTHSDEQENDPCHLLIYHNDREQGCDHDSHLIVSDNCQMCDLAYHSDQSILSDVGFTTGEFSSEHFDFYKLSLDSYWVVISSSRAPPALV